MFAIHGIPQEIVSDNGPQFRMEFKEFTQHLDIRHTISSTYHPQGNGKAENAVKTTKRIFKKFKGAINVLDFNNIPTRGLNISPEQIMFGRRCKTRMIIQKENLIPRYN